MRFLILAIAAATVLQSSAETVRCPARRDVWLSSYSKEQDCNMGAARKLKLKIHQEFALLDFDVTALRGRGIRAAWLTIEPVGGHKYGFNGNTDLSWLTVSTVAHPWVEGQSTGYRKDEKGHGATFNESSYGRADWGWPGAKVCDVALGHAHTLRCDARLERADGERWRLPLDVRLVRALVAEASHGLMVMDGSTYVVMNCLIASRESGKGPVLEVELGPRQVTKPAAVQGLAVRPAPGDASNRHGALQVALRVPERAFSYDVQCNGKTVGRWQIPIATKPGKAQRFALRDLPPDAACTIRVRAVSATGQPGAWNTARGRTSPSLQIPKFPTFAPSWTPAPPPTLGTTARVYALPPLTKLDPVTG
ncbi:MAG: fibronectin type III domain-containing protein, partial [Victivallales bacterium]|nr:fibronectin type III domain-containing protein [Victivallales bacterium]